MSVGSPAHQVGLRKNDILLAINGVTLTSGVQAAKLFSTSTSKASKNEEESNYCTLTLRIKKLLIFDHKKVVVIYYLNLCKIITPKIFYDYVFN